MNRSSQDLRITYIGHATTLIEIDGRRLITDPVFRSRILHLSRSAGKIDPDWYAGIDKVLVTHAHWDHLNIRSLRRVGGDPTIIVPPGVDRLVLKNGFKNFRTLEVGECTSIGEIDITAVHADHGGGRLRFLGDETAVGFLIEGSHSVYFAGDTDLFPEMDTLHDSLDVALLPVWGWGPTLGTGHMDPWQAAEAAALLKPKIAIPIHWGTFFPIGLRWLMPRFLRFPPLVFEREVQKIAPEVDVRILNPGDRIRLTRQLDGV